LRPVSRPLEPERDQIMNAESAQFVAAVQTEAAKR